MDIVLGAGIVGISIALHLQARGREVVLLDRGEPGRGTSFGNAGLLECSDLMPRGFPRAPGEIAHYATGTDIRAQFDWAFLPRLAPWLARYWYHSAPKRTAQTSRDITPLFINSLDEHKLMMADANALHLLRDDGWLHLYRNGAIPSEEREDVARARDNGMRADVLDPEEIQAREPALKRSFTSAIHWRDSATISDPGELSRLMAARFEQQGGTIVRGDAMSLRQAGAGWVVTGQDGKIEGENIVVALGPWSDMMAARLGYRFPLAVKRGYHMHYALPKDALPRLPVIDVELGYVLSPMTAGVRLTTAIEFAHRDAPPNPRQLDRSEPFARELYPLGERVDQAPWMGSRPCTADMRPIIGPAPRHKGLWFAFGHAHHGLTLGPITGRLLAEQISGETPFITHEPFLPARFG